MIETEFLTAKTKVEIGYGRSFPLSARRNVIISSRETNLSLSEGGHKGNQDGPAQLLPKEDFAVSDISRRKLPGP